MNSSKFQILMLAVTLALSGTTSAEGISREAASNLMVECQKQREENIAPLRAEAIADCVAKDRGDREYCETYNSTFGNAVAVPGGGGIPGLFWDLPICVEAVEADKYFKMNPGKETYSP